MLDLELIKMLKLIIEQAEPDFGIPLKNGLPSIPVQQSYQPTQQGVPTGPIIFLDIIGHRHYGQPLREDYFDDTVDPNVEVHRETQQMITRFQVGALATQDPASTTQYTSADILNFVAMILKNSQTVAKIEALGCGISLSPELRNPKFLNQSARFQASPSFDFDITHKLIVSREQPVLQSTELQIISI